MIPISTTGYVTTKIPGESLFSVTEAKCIPTGKTRTEGDETYAEFLLISGKSDERKIWRKRSEIY